MGPRVLVVEDEPIVGMDLMDLAEALGYEVAGPALSASSALMAAADRPPDIAIVDVNLTDGATGPYVASQLATAFGTEVLVITANPELVAEGVAGVVAVLTKPFSASDVAEMLTMLNKRHAMAAAAVRH